MTVKTKLPFFTECDIKIVLTDAVQALEDKGWCRTMMHNYATGASCSMGAISIATDDRARALNLPERLRGQLKRKSYNALGEAIAAWCEKNDKNTPRINCYSASNWAESVNIAVWNDTQVSDKRTVVRVFKKAIAAVDC